MFGFRLLLTTNSIGMINFSENEIAANHHHWSLAYPNVIVHLSLNMKSRMKGDFQVRFRENPRVQLPWVTRLPAMWLDSVVNQLMTRKGL